MSGETTVYVVTEYYPYEGGSPIAVFSNEEAAKEFAQRKQGFGTTPYYEVEAFAME